MYNLAAYKRLDRNRFLFRTLIAGRIHDRHHKTTWSDEQKDKTIAGGRTAWSSMKAQFSTGIICGSSEPISEVDSPMLP